MQTYFHTHHERVVENYSKFARYDITALVVTFSTIVVTATNSTFHVVMRRPTRL